MPTVRILSAVLQRAVVVVLIALSGGIHPGCAFGQTPRSPSITSVKISGESGAKNGLKETPISVGLRSQDWFFMWRKGKNLKESSGLNSSERLRWRTTIKNMDRYKALGAEWNLVVLHQGVDGVDGFARARKAVAEYQLRGIVPIFRLIENPSIYGSLTTVAGKYGYAPNYYKWVKSVAKAFQNDVQIYLIGNEVDSDLSLNLYGSARRLNEGTFINYEQYRKLLDTAYSAIKSVNRTLMVADHGVSSFAVALATADDMVQSGHPVAAGNFWEEYTFGRMNSLSGTIRLTKLLSQDNMRRRINVARKSYSRPGHCDLQQIHYYGGWKALSKVLAWIKKTAEAGGQDNKPLIATEIGYAMPSKPGTAWDGREKMVANYAAFSPRLQAINMIKDFAILTGNGVSQMEYWQMRSNNPKAVPAPLFRATNSANNFKAYPAAKAFEVFAHWLNGRELSDNQVKIKGATAYTFSGASKLTILWSIEDVLVLNKTNFQGFQGAYDMYGKRVSQKGGRFSVSSDPIYVYW